MEEYHENGGDSSLPSDCSDFLEAADVEDDTTVSPEEPHRGSSEPLA